MQLGHAAGIAAAIAAAKKQPVQQIDVKTLQEKLKSQGVIISRDAQRWTTDDKL
jgi:hypothetical protein